MKNLRKLTLSEVEFMVAKQLDWLRTNDIVVYYMVQLFYKTGMRYDEISNINNYLEVEGDFRIVYTSKRGLVRMIPYDYMCNATRRLLFTDPSRLFKRTYKTLSRTINKSLPIPILKKNGRNYSTHLYRNLFIKRKVLEGIAFEDIATNLGLKTDTVVALYNDNEFYTIQKSTI